jgi:flagellar assembly factor FliW
VRIASTRFGDIVITNDYIWEFPEGLIGLRSHRSFTLVSTSDADESIFMWLHSTTNGDLALPVMNPLRIFPDYQIRQDEPEILRLGLNKAKNVQVLVIVTVPPGDPEGITANLVAPLIIHPEKKKGWQVILEKGPYRVAQPLFASRDKTRDEGENIVSVGTLSPPVPIIDESELKKNSKSSTCTRILAQEVIRPAKKRR